MRFRIGCGINGEKRDFGFTRLIDTDAIPEQAYPYGIDYYFHRVYCCRQCGNVWAVWEREDSPDINWNFINRSCSLHPKGAWTGDIPGSLLLYRTDLIIVPRKVLEQELLLNQSLVEEEINFTEVLTSKES